MGGAWDTGRLFFIIQRWIYTGRILITQVVIITWEDLILIINPLPVNVTQRQEFNIFLKKRIVKLCTSIFIIVICMKKNA